MSKIDASHLFTSQPGVVSFHNGKKLHSFEVIPLDIYHCTFPPNKSTMTTVTSGQEEVVSKFAALLGTKRLMKDSVASSLVHSDPLGATSRELMLCLSKQLQHHEVICTLPSLDMRKIEEETGASPLPSVGQHFQTESIRADFVGGDKTVPQMEASVLNSAADASAKAAQVEQKAAQSLGSLTSWTKSSVVYAPSAISNNVADSFSSLVDSRVRAWTLLLLRHSLTTGDSGSRSRLLSMLSSIIKVDSAKTTFKTLPLPESAANQPKQVDVILPLLLEVDLQIFVQKKNDTVTLRAPGTISGTYRAQAELRQVGNILHCRSPGSFVVSS